MKYILSKEEFDAAPDAIKSEYTESEGSFSLKLEGHESHLISLDKKNIAESHRKEAERQLKEANAREEELIKQLEKSSGSKEDIERIRTEAQQRVEALQAEYAKKEQDQKSLSHKAMITQEAKDFAQKHFTVPTAIQRLFQDQLVVEEIGGKPVIRVVDQETGGPSIKSLSDLQKDFLENKEFSTIVKVSEGSGGGADRNLNGMTGSAGAKKVDVLSASPKDLVAAMKSKLGQS